ncbi:hypothetical protein DPMN_064709 [Dreissena polymorpha]|uniref:HARP domain-containing protein n=1 Tax=Dreissena polymorpha TaxID=45954 RepID=A0A9D4HME3_DREPO|nr:hypothetical protein DPMN_064709 [Dreissena polymorpha]
MGQCIINTRDKGGQVTHPQNSFTSYNKIPSAGSNLLETNQASAGSHLVTNQASAGSQLLVTNQASAGSNLIVTNQETKTSTNVTSFQKGVNVFSAWERSDSQLRTTENVLPAATCSSDQTLKRPSFFGAPSKGECILVSRDRFTVKIGYCAPLIELFKTMNTKLYDAPAKQWTISLSEYNKFMTSCMSLKPAVTVEPLPKALLTAFAVQIKGGNPSRDIPIADLSSVEQSLVSSLMSFQRKGVDFGVSKNGRVLIADDMGLGKTIQAICLARYYKDEWPLLVVVPSSVRFDWSQQFQRWVPSLDPQSVNVVMTLSVLHLTAIPVLGSLSGPPVSECGGDIVCITPYSNFQHWVPSLDPQSVNAVVTLSVLHLTAIPVLGSLSGPPVSECGGDIVCITSYSNSSAGFPLWTPSQ